MSFNIGDKIIINNMGNWYNFTKPGSIGTIIGIANTSEERYHIKFESLTCNHPPAHKDDSWIWFIDEECIDLLESSSPEQPYSKIIRKMKYLQHKFDTRKELANV